MRALYRFLPLVALTSVCMVPLGYGLLNAIANPQAGSPPATATSQPVNAVVATDKETKKADAPVPAPIVVWEAPTTDKPAWLTGNDVDHLSQKIEDGIRDSLHQRMEIEFNAQPLSGVCKFISDELKIPILIDDKALEEENITRDEPITIHLENAKACNALALILRPLQLTYKVEHEVLIVTGKKTDANTIRQYDLSFILPDNSVSDEITMLIQEMVTPQEWQSAGGNSVMRILGSMLVVSTPEEGHIAIQELLRTIAKQSKKNMKPQAWQQNPQMISGGMGGGFVGGMGSVGGGGMMRATGQDGNK